MATTYSLNADRRSVTSSLVYEYFLFSDAAKFPILRETKFVQFGSGLTESFGKIGDDNLTLQNNGQSCFFAVSTDAKIVAEDSIIKEWHFPIMCRITRYVPGPTAADWGEAYSLPVVTP